MIEALIRSVVAAFNVQAFEGVLRQLAELIAQKGTLRFHDIEVALANFTYPIAYHRPVGEKLYHGTSETAVPEILRSGLRPRVQTGQDNWATAEHAEALSRGGRAESCSEGSERYYSG